MQSHGLIVPGTPEAEAKGSFGSIYETSLTRETHPFMKEGGEVLTRVWLVSSQGLSCCS